MQHAIRGIRINLIISKDYINKTFNPCLADTTSQNQGGF